MMGGTKLNCPVGNREAGEETYCKSHAVVYRIILKKHDRLKKAKDISWKEYLSDVAHNELTGEWAKEMAQYLLQVENHTNVKNS